MPSFPPVATRTDITPETLVATVSGLMTPVIFKNLVGDWPLVTAARHSSSALVDYLKARDNGKLAETFRQAGDHNGKYFYGDDQKSLNFARASIPLSLTLDRLKALSGQAAAEHIYIQSAPLQDYLPKVKLENTLPSVEAEPRLWIGNRSVTQIHFDLYDNLACMVGGRKRFILFPPEQTKNLYIGPFDTTISGVPTSMADLENPDFAAHPRFRDALAAATEANLEPGDVLFIPYMWWHHVVSSDDLNAQVNYWWNRAADMGQPMQVLIHAMLSLRDLPANQNAAWKAMFDHFVFHQSNPVADHLRPEVRGIQGDLSLEQRTVIRRHLGKALQD